MGSSGRGARGGRNNHRSGGNRKVFRENTDSRPEKSWGLLYERPKWVPPEMPSEPIPTPDCPYCGKPIMDLSAAVTDRKSDAPVHFDCIVERITEEEALEEGDTVTYIGGGRFAVVNFAGENRNFRIKKILEWETREDRAEWRKNISDHFSIT
jgi:hypothetical protein